MRSSASSFAREGSFPARAISLSSLCGKGYASGGEMLIAALLMVVPIHGTQPAGS